MLDAIGARDDQRHRQAGSLAGGIAHEGGDVHVLAGAIHAALRVDEAVERARRLAALDAAVGQVEGTRGEIEEGVFAGRAFGHEHGRLQAAFTAGEAAIELGVAARVGLRGAEHLVVAGDQLDVDVGRRVGVGQRAHEGVHAVIAGEGGEAEVGDDEPLRRLGIVVLARLL